jgi:ribosomal protein S18 acetylase RimI-like enzyme
MVTVRPLAEDELSLLEESMHRPPGKHRERFERQQQGEAVYVIAWKDERPVGHLLLTWASNVQERAAGAPVCPHLSDIAVNPRYQSQGIGSRLMEAAERLVEHRGYERVGLSVALDNVRARRLYERRGYADAGIGEYQIRWSDLDDEGIEHWREETCRYLVKRLGRERTRVPEAPVQQ